MLGVDRFKEVNDTEAERKLALESGELTLFHQPQLNLSNGRVRSVEALVRWQHPARGRLL